MRQDLNLYVVFDAIYREGSVTKAAQRLNLTQPAISHALNRLRASFDDALFTRRGHVIVPTQFAHNIADKVRQALGALDDLTVTADSFSPAGARKTLLVGVRDVLEAALLPTLVRNLANASPGISIGSIHVERTALASRLASSAVDLAIDVLLEPPDEVAMQPLTAEHLCVVARHGHAEAGDGFNVDDYLRCGHVVVSARRQGRSFEDMELSKQGLRREIRLRCQHYFTAFSVVRETDLLLTMPQRYARVLNEAGMAQILPLPLRATRMEMFMYWHRSRDADPTNLWLRSQVRRAIEA